jgi:phosphoadenosine phosphosulfate reductase
MRTHSLPLENGRLTGVDAPKPAGAARLVELREAYRALPTHELLVSAIGRDFPGRIAAVSSFGAESVVLLHMLAQADPSVPVLFLNTGKLFGETLRYRDRVQALLGLRDLRSLAPDPRDQARRDPDGTLWRDDPDACCGLRKVTPLNHALQGFDAQITGRKRFQTEARAELEPIEWDGRRYKVNPLWNWDLEALAAYIEAHELPRHPLVDDGYLSIGCMPCTERVAPGGDYRSGRWAGSEKTECGIHGPSSGLDGDGI